MNKSQLIDKIAESADISKANAGRALDAFIGTVTDATPDTLSRDTVLSNSSGNTSKINFSGGTLSVFCTMPASKSVYLDATGTPVGAASAGFALAMAVAL